MAMVKLAPALQRTAPDSEDPDLAKVLGPGW